MAAAEHVIPVNEAVMELPSLPPNQGLEALKDIVFGSVRLYPMQLVPGLGEEFTCIHVYGDVFP